MPVFLLPILWRLGAAIVIGLIAWRVYYMAEHWCNTVCVDLKKDVAEERSHVAALDASIALTQKRASDLATLWSAQVDKTENAAHIAESLRNDKFRELAAAAVSIDPGQRAHFGGVASRLFERAADLASGSPATGPAPEPAPAAAPDTASAEEFVVKLYDWIGVCKATVDEWASFYAGLQQSSGSIQ